MKRLALLTIALLALTGQAPVSPIRHLDYAFAVYPAAKPAGGDYDGIIAVDIFGAAPDGGTRIRTTESWYYTPRARQSRTCEVFANGNVRCDDVPPYPSKVALVLLPLLARDFFNVAALNASAATTWQQNFTDSFNRGLYVTAVTMHMSATPQRDGRLLSVTSEGRLTDVRGTYRRANEQGKFLYDPAGSVPIIVHDVTSPVPARSVYAATGVDLELMRDSNPASAPALRQLTTPRFIPHQ